MIPRVLIAEDDDHLRAVLRAAIGDAGLEITEAASGDEALARLRIEGADLLLLDLMLPGTDGMRVLERLRTFSDMPVIVLTVRDSKDDKLGALDAGADDYVTKPFDIDELLARVRAALRRTRSPRGQTSIVTFDDVTIDRARRVVTRAGDEVKLTPTEWSLLDVLLQHGGQLVRYETIGEEISVRSGELDRAGTRMFVAQLRKKLGDDATDPRLILTHFGLGVRWIGPLDAGG